MVGHAVAGDEIALDDVGGAGDLYPVARDIASWTQPSKEVSYTPATDFRDRPACDSLLTGTPNAGKCARVECSVAVHGCLAAAPRLYRHVRGSRLSSWVVPGAVESHTHDRQGVKDRDCEKRVLYLVN